MFFESDTLGFHNLTDGGPDWGSTPSIGVFDGGTVYGSNPNPINWNQMWSNIFGVGSQAIAAWGQNPTQQVGNAGITGIGQGYSPAAIGQSYAAIAAAQAAANNPRNLQGGGGLGLDDAAGSITGFITRNPLLVAGGALGVYLLMRQPPGRR